ncbi:hypothetical protein NL676_002760 [Syzygium grande]|nr:hypothetical protein NL676_002760 [Syzygium grande]
MNSCLAAAPNPETPSRAVSFPVPASFPCFSCPCRLAPGHGRCGFPNLSLSGPRSHLPPEAQPQPLRNYQGRRGGRNPPIIAYFALGEMPP